MANKFFESPDRCFSESYSPKQQHWAKLVEEGNADVMQARFGTFNPKLWRFSVACSVAQGKRLCNVNQALSRDCSDVSAL
jgi:hypothetical protein